ncbi:MAG: hypothetical protein WB930_18765 [Syntrophobacteraceae bacterium]
MERWQFPIRKEGIFRPGKKIEGLRGGIHGYAAQASPKIDAAGAEKDPFRMETGLVSYWQGGTGNSVARAWCAGDGYMKASLYSALIIKRSVVGKEKSDEA